MRKAAVFMSAAALILSATTVSAQGKNLAGTWTVVADPAAPAPGRGGGRGLGQGATISQDSKTLTVTRTTQNGEVKTVYNIDGTDSKNTLTMGGNSVEQTSKARWEGDKLIIDTKMNMNGNDIASSMSLWIDAGGQLVVESTGAGRGGGPPTTTKMTYKKS
jgi:hypothetical protein